MAQFNKVEPPFLHTAMQELPAENMAFIRKLFIFNDLKDCWDNRSFVIPLGLTNEPPMKIEIDASVSVEEYYRSEWGYRLEYPLLPCIETHYPHNYLQRMYYPLECLSCYPSAEAVKILESLK